MSDETSGAGSGPDVEATGEARTEPAGDTESALDDAHHALREAQARLAEVPADVVVTNHVMGLYELGAIHLSTDPPDLVSAALAIDAVACLVEGLGDRLGDESSTLRDALANIRLAFVQVKGAGQEPRPDDG